MENSAPPKIWHEQKVEEVEVDGELMDLVWWCDDVVSLENLPAFLEEGKVARIEGCNELEVGKCKLQAGIELGKQFILDFFDTQYMIHEIPKNQKCLKIQWCKTIEPRKLEKK